MGDRERRNASDARCKDHRCPDFADVRGFKFMEWQQGHPFGESAPTQLDIPCRDCWEDIPLVNSDAAGFYCATCERDYKFVLCPACESVNQVRSKGHGPIVCDWCCSLIRSRAFGRSDSATAADWHAELAERGILNVDGIWVAGFTLLGGSGFDVEFGAVCSVLSLPDAVDVRAEVGGVGVATIPYADVIGLDIAGGVTTRGGGFIGGGFGLEGAAEGMLVASFLNSLTTKTSIDTGLAIASINRELLLNHNSITPQELRQRLSPLFTRFNAAKHQSGPAASATDDPIADLERLADLRDRGLLTAEEFEAARLRHVKRLMDGS